MGALTKRATGREFGVRSHGAGLLEAEPSGERQLGNDGCSGPAAPSPEPPDQPPQPPPRVHRPPPTPAALTPRRCALPAPQPTRCPRPRPSPASPASLVPGANQTNNASPAALLPLPADRLASSHLTRSRSEPRLSAGQSAPGPTRGPPGDPHPGADPRQAGGLVGAEDPSCVRGLKSLLCSRRRRHHRPGQLGKVGSPPCRASPRWYRPDSLSSPPRALGSQRVALGAPSCRLATPRPRLAPTGLGTPPAPRVRAAPAPRGAPRTFPAANPPRPVAVPSRAGAAAPGGTHFVRARAAAAPGERGVVGPERGAGAEGGGRRRPRATAAAAQPPRARAPIARSHLS